jgi:hypothetical protein
MLSSSPVIHYHRQVDNLMNARKLPVDSEGQNVRGVLKITGMAVIMQCDHVATATEIEPLTEYSASVSTVHWQVVSTCITIMMIDSAAMTNGQHSQLLSPSAKHSQPSLGGWYFALSDFKFSYSAVCCISAVFKLSLL